MKRTTKKLTGIGLELFLRRFFASYSGIDDGTARQLAQDGAKAFASVRVRRMAWQDWRRRPETRERRSAAAAVMKTPLTNAVPRPGFTTQATAVPPPPMEAPSASASESEAFDPYSIGLIPIFQREGADGLTAKLTTVASLDNLRKMARAQQVALPVELRGPDAAIDDVRSAIVAAVAKRVADRRAAAG